MTSRARTVKKADRKSAVTQAAAVSHKKRQTGRLRTKLVKGNETSVVIRDNTRKPHGAPAQKKERSIVVRSKLQLALLSPFRFPLPNERIVGSVARYAGVAFVLIGGFFSLLNIQYASGLQESYVAQTVSSTISGVGTNQYQTSMDSTPDVRINLENGGGTITGMAIVMVTVPYASEVKILALNEADNNLMPLGSAFQIDASTWRFYWDTRQYPDGTYRLHVAVKNQFGSYDKRGDATYEVDNMPDEESKAEEGAIDATNDPDGTALVSGGTDATAASTPPDSTTVNRVVSLSVEASPLSGDVSLSVAAQNATEVKVYARNVDSTNLFFVGLAESTSNNWRIVWKTELVPDGDYKILAKARYPDGVVIDSQLVGREVDNGTEGVIPPAATTTFSATPTTTGTTATPPETLTPTVKLSFSKPSPLSGFIDVLVETSDVQWVEVYALPRNSLTPYFLGLASRSGGGKWKYVWDTRQSPNGEYNVYVRVKTSYGFTEGSKTLVRIVNEVMNEYTEEQEEAIDTFTDAADELIRSTDGLDIEEDEDEDNDPSYQPPKVVYVEPVQTFVQNVEADDEEKENVEVVLDEFRMLLNAKLNQLARAIREEDQDALAAVKRDIENIKSDILKKISSNTQRRELLDDVDEYLSKVTFELQELTEKNEKILKERIGDAVVTDSDKDGITDYDEINLYRTNPFAADTDGDSYIDSVEIKLGYNPHDPKSESLVSYQSPKETGIVREDILAVNSIMTLTEGGEETPAVKAVISGKGLPNSFVTLYIFSTPIVLTVKTDSDGSWSYVFDKELEDGEHEIYVGITDNAGRVVARSNPLPFVKTASAFTAEAAAVETAPTPVAPSLADQYVMLLVSSITVVALGLVLILLGLHVRGREEKEVVLQQA